MFLIPGVISDGAVSVDACAVLVEGASQVDVFAIPRTGRSVIPVEDFAGSEFSPRPRRDGRWLDWGTPLTIPSGPRLRSPSSVRPRRRERTGSCTSMADV
jgi:hypothetical protein